MKRFVFCSYVLLTLMFGNSSVLGQEVIPTPTISWSSDIPQKGVFLKELIGADDEYFYTIQKEKTGNPSVVKYTLKGREVMSEEISDKVDAETHNYHFTLMLGAKLVLFTSKFKNKTLWFYMQELDKETLSRTGVMTEVCVIPGLRNWFRVHIARITSEDGKKLCLSYLTADDNLHAVIYSENMEEMRRAKIKLNEKGHFGSLHGVAVDNDGGLCILGSLMKEDVNVAESSEADKSASSLHRVVVYHGQGNEVSNYDFDLGAKVSNRLDIRINDRMQLMCVGFYADSRTSCPEGTVFFSVNTRSGEQGEVLFNEFPADFLTDGYTEKKVAKGKKLFENGKGGGVYDYRIRDHVVRDDGGIVLVSEQFAAWPVGVAYDPREGGSHYKDIVAVSYTAGGTVDWNVRISKEQVAPLGAGRYASYVMAVESDNVYFLFNDDPKNLELKNATRPEAAAYTHPYDLMIVKVSSEGSTTKKCLHDHNDDYKVESFRMMPLLSGQITNNEVVISARGDGIRRFANVKLK
jgi:hypothetical protein